MNRRSFVSILTGMCGAVMAGMGLRKKEKIKDPSDLPWRKGRKSQPISFPEIPTDTPLVAHGPGYAREPMADGDGLRVTTYHRIPNGRMIGDDNPRCFVLQNGQYVEIDCENRVVNCSAVWKSINPNWISAPEEWEEWKFLT